MIIDSSAIVAIFRNEPEAPAIAYAIETASICRMSAVSFVETAAVLNFGRDPLTSRRYDEMLRSADVIVEPVTAEQAQIARDAYRDFGKGSGHPAQLNLGDCFAYALAKDKDEPLLFKGNDFSHTDVTPALK